ncbi:MAG: ammonium transporter [Candidatus Competibacterales bacterium]
MEKHTSLSCCVLLCLLNFLFFFGMQSNAIAQGIGDLGITNQQSSSSVDKASSGPVLLGEIDVPIYIDRAELSEMVREIASQESQNAETLQIHARWIRYLNGELQKVAPPEQAYLNTIQVEIEKKVEEINERAGSNIFNINRFWVLIAAFLVFFMQAGFKVLEVGMVRQVHGNTVGMKNLTDWLVVCLCYYTFGFALMFGDSWGFFGWNPQFFMPTAEFFETIIPNTSHNLGFEFFLYQLAFATTAVTIISGATSERLPLVTYVFISIFVSMFLYPVFGHWTWSGYLLTGNEGWLAELGFHDFAGSTIVHSMGAWVALVALWYIKPRNFWLKPDGEINDEYYKPSNLGYAVLGVFILWFSWWGFNGGSLFEFQPQVSSIIMNTNLSGAAAALVAFFNALAVDKRFCYHMLIGGAIGGLVAITACCDVVTPSEAIVIGIVAGFVHNYSYRFLRGFAFMGRRFDDAIGAIPVHGFCGVWGTFAVAVFGTPGAFNFAEVRLESVQVQLLGIVVAFVFAVVTSIIFFEILKLLRIARRISNNEEEFGYTVGSMLTIDRKK